MSLPEAGGVSTTGRLPKLSLRRPAWRAVLAACAVAPFLSACGDGGFKPMYGSLGGLSTGTSERLAQVDVVQIPGRVGQRIRNELIFQTTGGGEKQSPTMRLEVAIRESVTSTLVRTNGDADGQIYSLEASYRLIRMSDNSVITSGTSFGRAGFERFQSIFSNVRARQDAEDRAAKTVGEDLKSQIAAYLSRPA